MTFFLVGMIGVIVGALIVGVAFYFRIRYEEGKSQKNRILEHKVKEIETLVILNKKINEILEKRIIMMDKYVSFDAFDDCYITVDDYIYLQSFAAQNSFYLPNYFLEEFFKKIATRKVVLSPEETMEVGGYTFKGGRVIIEEFSDKITEMMTKEPLTYFSKTL